MRSLPEGEARGGPVWVVGMFSTGSGLGQSARLCVEALRYAGFDTREVDVSYILSQGDLEAAPSTRFDPTVGGTLIVHLNPPESEFALYALGLRRWHSWTIIAYWAWELEIAPLSWRKAAARYREIWTLSEHAADAIIRRTSRQPLVIYPPIRAPQSQSTALPTKSADRPIRVLILADGRSSLVRKNVLGAIDVFDRAGLTPDEAHLIVKTRNLDSAGEAAAAVRARIASSSRFRLIDETVSDADRWKLLGESDIVLSGHRAEGYGLHLAEAMTIGKCVIATGWSANTEFMNSGNSILLPYELVPVNDPNPIYGALKGVRWAAIDVEASARLLASAVRDAKLRFELGEAARRDMAARKSLLSYANALTRSPVQRSSPKSA